MEQIQEIIRRYWGFSSLRPLQRQAIESVLQGPDSLVVLPTGGGKSLCYQAPAVILKGTTVVVSPLISLMKDQVDGLRACGINALQLDSSQSTAERMQAESELLEGGVPLLFVSPERLSNPDFQQLLRRIRVRTFAVDEAHCISHWGHDFRPEYRQLRRLREVFPTASLHAYTATATRQVMQDIIDELQLRNPLVLTGSYDRANLTYRVHTRRDITQQVLTVLGRHRGEAGIVYCIRRKEVDELCLLLRRNGIKAIGYHAGLTAQERSAAQESFCLEQCDLVVATVAFGMGIDRSNVRFVIHTGMPKSLEHYQQETGRAGRDGLEAECCLFYSGNDVRLWKSIIERSAEEQTAGSEFIEHSMKQLSSMSSYCRAAVCRHRALVEYFEQEYDSDNCRACDVCLGETVFLEDSQTLAKKILSCVARARVPFGAGHIASVLRGENTEAIRKWQHQELSTYGLLRGHHKSEIRDWIDQLVGQEALIHEDRLLESGLRVPVLRLNAKSWQVMRDEAQVCLSCSAKTEGNQKKAGAAQSGEASDKTDDDLFQRLRQLRKTIAAERKCPPYLIFNDATLRELSRVRPAALSDMLYIHGIGGRKLKDFGERFFKLIQETPQQTAATAAGNEKTGTTAAYGASTQDVEPQPCI